MTKPAINAVNSNKPRGGRRCDVAAENMGKSMAGKWRITIGGATFPMADFTIAK
jgi:hypothetical protein